MSRDFTRDPTVQFLKLYNYTIEKICSSFNNNLIRTTSRDMSCASILVPTGTSVSRLGMWVICLALYLFKPM